MNLYAPTPSVSGKWDLHPSVSGRRWDLHPSVSGRSSGRWTKGPVDLEGRHQAKEDYSQALKFWTCMGPVTSSFFLIYFSYFGMEMSVLCLSYHCILEAYNLFYFTGSQLEETLPQDKLNLNQYLAFTYPHCVDCEPTISATWGEMDRGLTETGYTVLNQNLSHVFQLITF